MKRLFLGVLICAFPMITLAAPQVPRELHLRFDDRILTLNFQAQPELLQRTAKHFVTFGDEQVALDFGEALPGEISQWFDIETDFVTEISPEGLEAFFLSSSIFQKDSHQAVELLLDEEKNIVFEGSPYAGYDLNMDLLVTLINQAIAKGQQYVRVPGEKTFSQVVAHPDLKERGIQEIIAVGESNFTGSSEARRQNILAATRKFNGMIIPRGRYFSFNDTLESVEEEDGFVKELVIKGSQTEKELGGGVCQVSTTVFRAAFAGGLPITQRRNHSYAVPYYQPFGLDATIYLGGQDFRFKNDTPGDILVQAFVQEDDLYFIFYGTNDGRHVAFEGPFISDYRRAPDPIMVETAALPRGETQVFSPSHDGFATEWIRRISRGDEVEEEVFASNYRAWPARILKGIGKKQNLAAGQASLFD